MQGDFELNKPGWYTVQQHQLNDFLNDKLESDQYGLWYSVQFEGDADTFLWQTKTEPVKGEKYWGWLEKTKSGKAIKFKWDKQNAPANLPSGEPTSYTKQETNKSHNITLGLVWKTVAGIRGLPENDDDFAKFFAIVDAHLKELLAMSAKLSGSQGDGGLHTLPPQPIKAPPPAAAKPKYEFNHTPKSINEVVQENWPDEPPPNDEDAP